MDAKPQIGQWYRHLDKGELFQVTGIDETAGTIDIQMFGGDIDELDAEAWQAMPLAPVDSPEDWTGPMDDIEPDDLGYSDTQSEPANRTQPPPAVESWGALTGEESEEAPEETEPEEAEPEEAEPEETPPRSGRAARASRRSAS